MAPSSGTARGESSSPLPSGTVTFFFSDIEGSTQRWESFRDAMQAAVAQHERLLRAAIERHHGYVFKTIGDAFCAAFATAPEAARAALESQTSLAAEDFSAVGGLRVRIGIHTGHADERDGDYFGPAVNRVARLMSIGHGGQILLSAASRALVESELPQGASIQDLGSHRLKDLTNPEQVWQLTIPGAAETFPPLKSLDALPNNLPIHHTSFRGRERDLDDVKKLLREHHLVTLFGPGGIGKTRLALQAAAEVLDDFPDGVWLADLGAISDPELVPSVIAKVLGVVPGEEHTVSDALVQWLKRKQLLLILDNCEHLLETVTQLVDSILRTSSGVRIVTTSRQALGISGEFVYRLASLEMPAAVPNLSADEALRYGAIALFVDRATASDMRFALTDDNVPGIADICRRLDGIPLAIELAAARVKVLSIPNLAQRLNERFKILTAGSRTAVPRQKTLSALIDWSYDLLSTQERTLFDRCAIFAGGFSLDAASAVCAGEGVDEADILDLLASLSDKSLVVAETSGEQERYRFLESTRAYAVDRLVASGAQPAMAQRHARYFCDFAVASDDLYLLESTQALAVRLGTEADNFRGALEWSIKRGNDVVLGATLAAALHVLWSDGGLRAEGRYWIDAALAALDESTHPLIAGGLWIALSRLSAGQRRYDAAQRASHLYEHSDDGRRKAMALYLLSSGCLQTGRMEQGLQVSTQAVTDFRKLGIKAGEASTLASGAIFAWSLGDVTSARKQFEEALSLSRHVHDETELARIRGNFAEFEFAGGNPEKALINALEAMTTYARGRNFEFLATYGNNSSAYRVALNDLDGAYDAAFEAVGLARESQSAFDIAVGCQHLALIGALRGHTREAALVLGYVNEKFGELGIHREYTEKWGFEKIKALLAATLSAAELDELTKQGAKLSDDQAIEAALPIAKP
ncbi:MAG TPA: adenylate/guanylate cyclase domain-containing protein [Candidatus Eremiobacteraceae bacterium]|nr:adenylate/guanylate cyclase domain-containing protein [Candidatus Eremiobacteraceae bacterium]